MVLPVKGFLPSLAALLDTEKYRNQQIELCLLFQGFLDSVEYSINCVTGLSFSDACCCCYCIDQIAFVHCDMV